MRPIKVGDKLPSRILYEGVPENPRNILDVVSKKKAIIFGVPGAFVPGCSKVHLKGFIQRNEDLRFMGYEEIICIAMNDPYVLSAWGHFKGADDKVKMFADPSGSYTRAIGMDIDVPELGGTRSRRYSMATVNGIVRELYIDETDSSRPTCLRHQKPVPTYCV